MRGVEILVVEDEPLSRDVLVRLLESRGFAAACANDGPAGLQFLRERTPSLVLLDVSMPAMSGLEVLRCIRQEHTHDQLPVILVTAMVDSDDVIAGLEAGANDYVVKPVNLPVLLARINVALRIKHGVERLMKAERHRVMLEALDSTCAKIAGPMADVIGNLEQLLPDLRVAETNGEPGAALRPRLEETLAWAREAGAVIAKLQKIASYQRIPYTDGLGGFVEASLESVAPGEPLREAET
jgi:two-component system sensor histidine kinase ChiS